jgi:glycerol uptake facilitator-like aquaporin
VSRSGSASGRGPEASRPVARDARRGPDVARRLVAEALGTAFLLAAIVGSGIVVAGEPSASAALLQHALVVGLALSALIVTFGPVSGAHLNPVVTLVDAVFGGLPRRLAVPYVGAQLVGAVAGTVATHLAFGEPALAIATNDRLGAGLLVGEGMATAGLLLVIFGVVRSGNVRAVPAAVGAYIGAAIVFTSSASFANPAVTVARAVTDTWVAISPRSVPGFLAAQLLGAALAAGCIAWLFRPDPATAADVVVPHPEPERSTTT